GAGRRDHGRSSPRPDGPFVQTRVDRWPATWGRSAGPARRRESLSDSAWRSPPPAREQRLPQRKTDPVAWLYYRFYLDESSRSSRCNALFRCFQHLRQLLPFRHAGSEVGAVLGQGIGLPLGFFGADEGLQSSLGIGNRRF